MSRDGRGHDRLTQGRVLFRTFFAQFFASESVTSDMQLRQTIVWVLAFLIAPLVVLCVLVFPRFQWVAIRAVRFHDTELLSDTLEWIEFLFITYAMVTVGLITVFVWDALAFDRRDAMTLGPLPVPEWILGGAKLAALGAFMVSASTLVSGPSGFLFAMETSDQFGGGVFIAHLLAHLAATAGAAAFTFAVIVAFRGVVEVTAGPRIASALGPLLQFGFVVLILALVILTPAVWRIPHSTLVNPTVTGWLPGSWFLGLFERLRGSSRLYFVPLATRALVALPLAIGAAGLLSVITFQRHLRLAIAPPATPARGLSSVVRRLARWLAGPDAAARASADFVVMTMARNRRQQGPIAMSAAVGTAVVLASIVQKAGSLESLMRPRTLVLWIPLVISYWTVLGMRAAFLLPSDLRAAVTFAVSGPRASRAYWSGTRAATIAWLACPITVLTAAVTAALTGWRVAAWHTAFVAGMVTALIEACILTLDGLPFTRPYTAGDASLRTRWPLYFLGMYAFAYFPVQLEVRLLGGREAWLVAATAMVVIALQIAGSHRARRWSIDPPEKMGDEGHTIVVLDIGAIVHSPTVPPRLPA